MVELWVSQGCDMYYLLVLVVLSISSWQVAAEVRRIVTLDGEIRQLLPNSKTTVLAHHYQRSRPQNCFPTSSVGYALLQEDNCLLLMM